MKIERIEVSANGLRFGALSAGSGPLVVLLHGFPDRAETWEHQIAVLAAVGYRVVAPYLRGYPPTEIPAAGAYYDLGTLATDLCELIRVLNGDAPAYFVGQDWGAAIGYALLAAYPEAVRRAVLLAVPHPLEVRRTLKRSPIHALRSFHWFLFQLPGLPEWLCRRRDHAFLETLWKLWSPAYADHEHVASIRRAMREPGALEVSLAYYRAMFRRSRQDPQYDWIRARLTQPITVPTRVLCGAQDMRGQMLPRQTDLFASEYDWGTVEGAGHFLHREQPIVVNELILEWLRRDVTTEHDHRA